MQPTTTAVLIPAATKRQLLARKHEPVVDIKLRAAYFSKVTHKIALTVASSSKMPVVIDNMDFVKEVLLADYHYVDAWLRKDGYKLTLIEHDIRVDPLSFLYSNPYKGVSISYVE